MNAMTMEFPVRDGKEFQKLKQGMRIEAMVVQEVDGYDYWMEEIQEK